jgi:hypothetical protein
MSTKVVINICYGGFSISRLCAKRMAELGNKEAKEMLTSEDNNETFDDGCALFYGYLYDTPRHCPTLVQAVEELGKKSFGRAAMLSVVTLKGNKYIIEEYDGTERITEPKDMIWITVDD